ncbi:integrase [gut metagenome]|uniref:Integrase n=1 Tax=gut metagenome TaxID=749906 RepID=J9G038_9ZZZZ
MSVISKMRVYAPNLTFDDINKEWLDDYYLYLRKELDNNDNTAYKNMAVLKKYVRMAYKDGYMDENPFDEWMIWKIKTNCVYLIEEELETLVDLYRHGRLEYKLHKTLEFFLFMCFSSLHIGDVKRLQLEQFSDTSFTYFRMKLKNRKPEPIVVPISAPLASLLREIVGHATYCAHFFNLYKKSRTCQGTGLFLYTRDSLITTSMPAAQSHPDAIL